MSIRNLPGRTSFMERKEQQNIRGFGSAILSQVRGLLGGPLGLVKPPLNVMPRAIIHASSTASKLDVARSYIRSRQVSSSVSKPRPEQSQGFSLRAGNKVNSAVTVSNTRERKLRLILYSPLVRVFTRPKGHYRVRRSSFIKKQMPATKCSCILHRLCRPLSIPIQ